MLFILIFLLLMLIHSKLVRKSTMPVPSDQNRKEILRSVAAYGCKQFSFLNLHTLLKHIISTIFMTFLNKENQVLTLINNAASILIAFWGNLSRIQN